MVPLDTTDFGQTLGTTTGERTDFSINNTGDINYSRADVLTLILSLHIYNQKGPRCRI